MTLEATSSSGRVVTFTATATDNKDGALTPVCTPASGSTFPLGTTTVACSAADSSGNTGTASFTITVRDTTAPALSLPSSMTLEATSSSGRVVTFTATATDIVDGSRPVTCTPASGSTFPLGTTTVACSATDTRGNTASGSFSITIRDTTAPTVSITSPANGVTVQGAISIIASATDSAAGVAKVEFYVDGILKSTDTTFPYSYSLDTTSLSNAAHTIKAIAYDAANNQANHQISVTVSNTVADASAPIVTPPSNQIKEATSASGAVVSYPSATATDNVDGSLTAVCTPASGSSFPLGTTTVTCTATDSSGNTGSATFTVTVRDTTAPSLSLPANK
ncbi:MAG: HYR domain-containing protein, partial [Nitrososphaera sp.]